MTPARGYEISEAPECRRHLGLGASVALILGSMVGVGIFLTPAEVAKASRDIWTYLGFWLAGGVAAAAGALVYAELGSMFPRAGGDYVFLNEAFGRPIAFAWGWLSFLAAFSGSIAALAVGAVDTLAATSFGTALGDPIMTIGSRVVTFRDCAAVGIVWLISATNCLGASLSARMQLALTWTPIVAFVGAGLVILALGGGSAGQALPAASEAPAPPATGWMGLATGAYCAVFFAFSGWNVLTYVGGEVKRPGRTIPAATLTAVAIMTAAYLLLNGAFLAAIPLDDLRATPNAGVATAMNLLGPAGADVFAVMLAIAILASLNVATMAGSRIWFAMARHGYLWNRMSEVHPRWRTPAKALIVQGVWTSVLVLTGSFTFLVTFTGSVMLLLSCLTVAAVFVLRRRGLTAPYRSFGYPWVPGLYVLFGVAVIAVGLFSDGIESLAGVVAFVVLVGVYRVAKKMPVRGSTNA